MNKNVEITVDPEGQSKVETKGFSGGECREASRFVERAVDARTAETLAAEFHRPRPAGQEPPRSH